MLSGQTAVERVRLAGVFAIIPTPSKK